MFSKIFDKLRPAKAAGPGPATTASLTGGAGPQATIWQPGDTILGRYRVENVFAGAMGKVYIAQHLGWKIPVAIKVPKAEVLADPEGYQRIFTEADSWVRMGMHPNVATCFYVLTIDGVPHLFIEYVDGGDLSTWLKAGRCRDPRTALSMAIQFCHGMEFTHAKGIIHRDIKPQNILVTKNALVKITDFGIVQCLRPEPGPEAPLAAGPPGREDTVGFRGTPAYASPEQFRNSHAVDRRSDIFSFGICLWLMFCGRKPYADNRLATPLAPTPPAGAAPLPAELVTLLKKVVAFKPDERYQDFAELRHDLNQVHVALYRVDCPYMEVDFTDLEAENYNNRAVSFLELGKTAEAERCLSHALEINDSLPEAVFNDTLFLWRQGRRPEDFLLRRIEAVRQRLPKNDLVDALALALKRGTTRGEHRDQGAADEAGPGYPEYALCLPKNSIEVFRGSQLNLASQRNIVDLLAKGQYQACQEALRRVWQHSGFRRNQVLLEVYEQLLPKAVPGAVRGLIRRQTLPAAVHEPVPWLAMLPGGRSQIVFLTPSGRVLLRPFGPERKIKVLERFPAVALLAVSHRRQCLAVASPQGAIHVVSLAAATAERKIPATGKVTALAFSADGARLACGYDSGRLEVIELATAKVTPHAVDKSGAVRSILCLGPRHGLISGHEDGSVCFWEHGVRDCQRQLAAHALPVTMLSASPDESVFLSCAADRVLKLWNRRSGQCTKSIKPHAEAVNGALMLPDNAHFLTAGDDDLIKVWAIDSGLCRCTVDGRGDGVAGLALGPTPHTFLAAGNDGTVTVWMVIYDLEFSE